MSGASRKKNQNSTMMSGIDRIKVTYGAEYLFED